MISPPVESVGNKPLAIAPLFYRQAFVFTRSKVATNQFVDVYNKTLNQKTVFEQLFGIQPVVGKPTTAIKKPSYRTKGTARSAWKSFLQRHDAVIRRRLRVERS